MLWLTLVALLLISAFFSGSETGMMSLNRYRLRHQRKKSAGARRAAKLLAVPDRLIGLILIGNNAVNILAAIIANMLAILCWRGGGPLGSHGITDCCCTGIFRSHTQDYRCPES